MILKDLLYKARLVSARGNLDKEINSLHIDSRGVKSGGCFFAIKGTQADGHAFIDNAIENGAVAVVCETMPARLRQEITYVQVADAAATAGIVSHLFYGEPSQKIKLIGVTGTNGKTTVATLLFRLFTNLGFNCGLLSTIHNQVGDRIVAASHTTPDAIQLNELLARMVSEGCQYVFMENSSHAIQQQRAAGLHFSGAIFTNISHDHLDYHKTFDEYIRVKKMWFDNLPTSCFALSNADDKRGAVMLQNTRAKKYFYSLRTVADFKAKILENSLEGLHLQINNKELYCKLIGEFNAYNLLAVYGAAMLLGQNEEEVLLQLSSLEGAEGRFDYTVSNADKILGIVDYAHTPDALLNVLATIKNLKHGDETVITVVGCGGDRDKAKRPVMAEVAGEYSNKVILTSDNPRTEDPTEIIKDMESGIKISYRKKYLSIADRKEAIKAAITMAGKRDIVLVAGKGHEKYQEINGVKYPFDDKAVVREMFELLEK